MSYKPKPTAAITFEQLKRYVNDQFKEISNEMNKPTGVTVTTGTWTPFFQTGSGSVTYAYQVGNWTKINDLIFIEGRISLSAENSSGTVQITGLPAPIKSGHQGLISFYYDNYTGLYAGLKGYVDGSVIHVREQNATGNEDPVLTNNSSTEFNGFYRV